MRISEHFGHTDPNSSVTRRSLRLSLFGSLAVGALLVPALVMAADHTPNDGCAPGLSSDSMFWAAGPANTWIVDTGSGSGGCHLRTANTMTTRINWAEWYLPYDDDWDDSYSFGPTIYSYSTDLTHAAHYTVWDSGHGAGISDNKYLNQNGSRWGYCYNIGSAFMVASSGGLVDIEDKTGETAGTKWIAVDQFCYID